MTFLVEPNLINFLIGPDTCGCDTEYGGYPCFMVS